MRDGLAHVATQVDDAERIDQLRALEQLKSAACAAQARIAVALDASQRQAQARADVPAAKRGQGVGAQIALARRESPARGGRYLGLAKALLTEMPHTYAALAAGIINEWRATLLVRESACLTKEDRAAFDAEVAGDPTALDGLGDGRLVALAKQIAYRLDPASVVARARRAEQERSVSIRPAPDTMTYLTALVPVAQGVSVHATLTRAADSLRAQGDSRSRGQIMADTLVERVTGNATASVVPVEVQLVITDRALLDGDHEPAFIPGYGTVPAGWARDLLGDRLGEAAETADAATRTAAIWLRRLFTAPATGQLVAMESRRRLVPPGLAAFIGTRDGTCRTPWCDAPIRHRDHVRPAAEGGPTTAENLQGLCERCNYDKQSPGWHARAIPEDDDHLVETTTPTGHRYRSRAPALPGRRRHPRAGPAADDSPAERLVIDLLYAS